jgi:undecaprenyl-phosphate 4-deoxy-4-formamido-L-arabinose transferase
MNKYDYEFILVNDGSEDNTYGVIEQLSNEYPFVIGIDLAKNCGQHNAILAAISYADGDYILGMDDDFQTHPSQIYKLIDMLEEGYDMVYGRFPQRHHSLLRNLESKLHNMTVRYLTNKPKDLKACPMYIIRRFVRDEIVKSKSTFTNLQGLFLRTTAKIANADIEHFDRKYGKSGYNLKKLLKLWSAFLNYSAKPIRLVGKFGIAITFFSVILLVCGIVFGNVNVILSSVVTICTGFVIMSLGIIGEYIARMFMVITNEPQYIIRRDTKGNKEVE